MAFFKFLAHHRIDLLYWLVILGMMAAGGYVFKRYRPKDCPFDITDSSIWHPFVEHESISPAMVTLASYAIPPISISIDIIIRSQLEIHNSVLGLYFVLATLHLIDAFGWSMICKPRPDLIARCIPDFNLDPKRYRVQGFGQIKLAGRFTVQTPLFVNIQLCSTHDKEFLRQEGFNAFPSGHVAYAFGCNMYAGLWLVRHYSSMIEGKEPFTNPTEGHTVEETKLKKFLYSALKAVFISTPGRPSLIALIQIMVGLGFSVWVANTRHYDNRHSVFDIIISALYGSLVGWLGFMVFEQTIVTTKVESKEVEVQEEGRANSWP